MLNRGTFIAAAAAAAVAAGCMSNTLQGNITLAAGDYGGLYLAVCEIFAQRLRARYPGIDITVLRTEGSVDNLNRLRSGDADIGLAQGDLVERDRTSGPPATAPLAMARLYEDYLQLVVPANSPIQHINDLVGLRVSIGLAGSGVAAMSNVLFAAASLTDRIHTVNASLNDGLAALGHRRIDALVWSGGIPTPAISALNASLPLRILDLRPWIGPMTQLASYPYLLLRAPAGTYVPSDIHTIGAPDILLCRPGLQKSLAVAAVDVLASDAAQLMPPDVRGLQYLSPPSMIQTGKIPLHPGAIEAYRTLHG